MNLGKCAYCGREQPLSKEEVFPKFLAHKVGFHIFVDRRRGLKPLRLPPVLRDVCQNCNNVVLSQLDSYVSSLFKSYFLVPISSPVHVTFSYKFELLTRGVVACVRRSSRGRFPAKCRPVRRWTCQNREQRIFPNNQIIGRHLYFPSVRGGFEMLDQRRHDDQEAAAYKRKKRQIQETRPGRRPPVPDGKRLTASRASRRGRAAALLSS